MRASRDCTPFADDALPFQRHTCRSQYNSLANYRRHRACNRCITVPVHVSGPKSTVWWVTLTVLERLFGYLRVVKGMTTHRERVLVISKVVDPQPSTRNALCLYCHCAFKRSAHRSMNPSCAARSPTPSRLASAGDLPQRCCQLDWQQEGARLLHWSPKLAALAARIAGHSRIRGGIDAGGWGWVWERCWRSTLVTFLTHA